MYDADGRKYCSYCDEKSCSGCEYEMPPVLPGNAALIELLRLCSRQWLCNFDGPYAMNWQVIAEVAGRFGITRNELFYRKLSAFEAGALAGMEKGTNDQ